MREGGSRPASGGRGPQSPANGGDSPRPGGGVPPEGENVELLPAWEGSCHGSGYREFAAGNFLPNVQLTALVSSDL